LAKIILKEGKEPMSVMSLKEMRVLMEQIFKPLEKDIEKMKKVIDRLLIKVADLESARGTLSVDGEPDDESVLVGDPDDKEDD